MSGKPLAPLATPKLQLHNTRFLEKHAAKPNKLNAVVLQRCRPAGACVLGVLGIYRDVAPLGLSFLFLLIAESQLEIYPKIPYNMPHNKTDEVEK